MEILGDSNSDSSWEEPLEPIPPMEPAPRLVPIPTMEPFHTLLAGPHVYKCYVSPSHMKEKYPFLLIPCLLMPSKWCRSNKGAVSSNGADSRSGADSSNGAGSYHGAGSNSGSLNPTVIPIPESEITGIITALVRLG